MKISRFLPYVVGCAALSASGISLANDAEIESLKKRLAALEKKQTITEQRSSSGKFYTTLRPSLTHNNGDDSNIDVTDFLSHAGFYFEHELANGWTGIGHGEWSVDISNNGDFGKSRRAYVGIDSPYGRVAIGKQRPVHYLLIAEYVDIFNHANAPFAYDNYSPFFVNNLVTYKKQWQHVSFLAHAQFNGLESDDAADMVNVGVSYDRDDLHLAVAYLTQDFADANNDQQVGETADTIALSAANKFDNGFYIAAAWQERDLEVLGGSDSTQTTVDVSMAYPLSKKYTVKAGYFHLDNDAPESVNNSHHGVNVTLEHHFSDNFQIHGEVLRKTFDYQEDSTAISIGLKYNFSMKWQAGSKAN